MSTAELVPPKEADENIEIILDRFHVIKSLGEGSYGKVKLVNDTKFDKQVALKIIPKNKNIKLNRVKREIRILRLLHHPHIVKLYDVFESDKEIILSMEYVEGGELFNYIVTQKRVKEVVARKMLRQIVSALDYCHSSSIIHRDLKPENLLLNNNNDIKIIDFGFVNLFHPDDTLSTFCGSPYYASPEMVLAKQYHGPEVDIWSLGVILYALLSGQLPFKEKSTTDLYRSIASASFVMQPYFSETAKDLITKMLTADPTKRATLQIIKSHTWINEGYDSEPESHIPHRPVAAELLVTLDQAILDQMESFGFDSSAVQTQIAEESVGPAISVYHLLKEHIDRMNELQSIEKHTSTKRRSNATQGKTSTSDSYSSATASKPHSSLDDTSTSSSDAGSRKPSIAAVSTTSSRDSTMSPNPTSSRRAVTPSTRHAEKVEVKHINEHNKDDFSSPHQSVSRPRSKTSGHVHSYSLNRQGAIIGARRGTTAVDGAGHLAPPTPHGMAFASNSTTAGLLQIKDETLADVPASAYRRRNTLTTISPATLPSAHGRSGVQPKADSTSNSNNNVGSPTCPSTPNSNGEKTLVRRKSRLGKFLTNAFSKVTGTTKATSGQNISSLSKSPSLPRITVRPMFLGSETTSTRPLPEVKTEIFAALQRLQKKGIFTSIQWEASWRVRVEAKNEVTFELEIISIENTSMYGVEFKRIHGLMWDFQKVCKDLMSSWAI